MVDHSHTPPFIENFLRDAERKHRRRTLRPVVPVSARECLVDGAATLNFSSNNYLALADHPLLKERSIQWTRKHGAGSTASRLVCGTFAPYAELEETIAAWKGKEAALIMGSGFLANIGVVAAIADRGGLLLADKLNHASLNAGCRLARARFRRFPHRDLDRLRRELTKKSETGRTLVVSDTVFSMDGDLADVNELRATTRSGDAVLYLDDAHGTGVFGDEGSGLASGADGDVIMGTFSKAMGSYGAYVACSGEFRDYLVNRCQSFIYTTAPPPGVHGAIEAALELVRSKEFDHVRSELLATAERLRRELRGLGFDVGDSRSPIIPIIVGGDETALRISRTLLEKGILAVAIRPPTVPEGSARIRVSLNAAHTDADLDRLLSALKAAGEPGFVNKKRMNLVEDNYE